MQTRRDFSRTNHGVVLKRFGFLIALEVGGLGLAEHAVLLGIGLDAGLAHLQPHKGSGERHLPYVVAGGCLHSHHVAHFERDVGRVDIEPLAGVLELHLNHIVVGITAGDILEVVEAVELAADGGATSTAAAAPSATAGSTRIGLGAIATGFFAATLTARAIFVAPFGIGASGTSRPTAAFLYIVV